MMFGDFWLMCLSSNRFLIADAENDLCVRIVLGARIVEPLLPPRRRLMLKRLPEAAFRFAAERIGEISGRARRRRRMRALERQPDQPQYLLARRLADDDSRFLSGVRALVRNREGNLGPARESRP